MTSRRLYRDPLGVRLRDLATMLAPTTIKTTLQDNTLTADHGTYTVQVEVVPATVQETDMGPIKAVVLVNTEIPKPIRELLGSGLPGMTAMCNKYAALASVYEDGDSLRIGSRLTIYEAEDAWDTLHLPSWLSRSCSAPNPSSAACADHWADLPRRRDRLTGRTTTSSGLRTCCRRCVFAPPAVSR